MRVMRRPPRATVVRAAARFRTAAAGGAGHGAPGWSEPATDARRAEAVGAELAADGELGAQLVATRARATSPRAVARRATARRRTRASAAAAARSPAACARGRRGRRDRARSVRPASRTSSQQRRRLALDARVGVGEVVGGQALAVARRLPGARRAIDRGRIVERRQHVLGERAPRPHRVAHALAGDRVLEVPGVAGQRPARAGRGAEERRRLAGRAQLGPERRAGDALGEAGVLARACAASSPRGRVRASPTSSRWPISRISSLPAGVVGNANAIESPSRHWIVGLARRSVPGQRVVEVAEDQAAPVARHPVRASRSRPARRPSSGARRRRRPASTRPRARSPSRVAVAHAGHAAGAPAQPFDACSARARRRPARARPRRAAMSWRSRGTQTPKSIPSGAGRSRSRADDAVGLERDPADPRGVQGEDPRQRAHAAPARWCPPAAARGSRAGPTGSASCRAPARGGRRARAAPRPRSRPSRAPTTTTSNRSIPTPLQASRAAPA